MIKSVCWSLCKVTVFIVKVSLKFNFLIISSINTQISNFMKIRPVGDELFHADIWTDRRRDAHDKANSHLISSFRRVLNVVCNLLGCSPAYGV
jgi:hypothetical protein